MAEPRLRLTVRTPEGCPFDTEVRSLRVPTDSGQVGLRPKAEAAAMVVEPGLVLASESGQLRFVATAGGVLRCDGTNVVLLTPLAVVGESAEVVRGELQRALETPRADLQLRAALQRLETGILQELRRSTSEGGPTGPRPGRA